MKEQSRIPTSKIKRATRFVKTGVKVGGNYVKHYTKKAFKQEVSKEKLDAANAKEIYGTLSELKGSALKIAQMLSMERNMLPDAYTDIFSLAQHKAPPLSGPLIIKTFKQYMGKAPQKLYEQFDMKAVHAASIGQVHQATKDGKKLAVKIQYPGVRDSIHTDLKLVKPFALTLLGFKDRDVAPYFKEVEIRLFEETNYNLELERSVHITENCKHLPNLVFPTYYPELSAERVLTMDWLSGISLSEFIATNPSQALRNKVGQTLWNFYTYQIHQLKITHADPHPGNFLVQEDGTVGVIDFGCIKEIPTDFYYQHFALIAPKVMNDPKKLESHFLALEMIYPSDTIEEKKFFIQVFKQMLDMLHVPFTSESFDFGNDAYFEKLYAYGENLYKMPEIRQSGKPRGSKHVLYTNRTLIGLFRLLNELKATVKTDWALI